MKNNVKGQHHLPNAPWWYRQDLGDYRQAASFKANAACKRRKDKKKEIVKALRESEGLLHKWF